MATCSRGWSVTVVGTRHQHRAVRDLPLLLAVAVSRDLPRVPANYVDGLAQAQRRCVHRCAHDHQYPHCAVAHSWTRSRRLTDLKWRGKASRGLAKLTLRS